MIDFSVITATYNAERTVAACLESVQKNNQSTCIKKSFVPQKKQFGTSDSEI